MCIDPKRTDFEDIKNEVVAAQNLNVGGSGRA